MAGWFDEQIKQRKRTDDTRFRESFARMASTVMGKNAVTMMADSEILTQNAIEDILKSFHLKSREIPDRIKNADERLEYVLRPHGIMHRMVKLTRGWYKDAVGPMLAVRRDDGTMVALLRDDISGYRYFDTHEGIYKQIDSKSEGLFEEEAMCFYRSFPLRPMDLKDLIVYIFRTVSPMDQVMLIAAAIGVSLVGLLLPVFQNVLFSKVAPKGNLRVLMAAAGFFVAYSISLTLISIVKTAVFDRIMNKTDFSVRAAVMMRVLSLPADFFREYGTGELAQRVEYVSSLSQSIMTVVYSTGLTAICSLVYVVQIRNFAPGLMWPAIAIIVVNIFMTVILSMLALNRERERMKADAKNSSLVYAMISGLQKIKLAGAEKRAFTRWADSYAEVAELEYDLPWHLKLRGTLTSAVGVIGSIVIYIFAVSTGVNTADYFSFNTSYGMVMGAFQSLAGIAVTVAQIRAILELAEPIMKAEPEASEDKKIVDHISGGIELSHVSFRYSKESPYIINDLSIKIRPGQYVAIVGRTGCGKSTLMRLLLGFEKPEKGAIYYDGVDMKKLDLKSLRRKIGVVIQNGKLIMGSIFENVAIACPGLTMDEAWDACEKAGIADDIRRMPMGMSTMVTEGSGGISGGQRQRLMIARAIAGRPRLLMLDEATSALDNKTQKQVTEALDALNCTRIVIAHRLSTIRQCDRILVLDGGRITEEGSYEELIEKGGYFAALVERQRLDI
ncbi:MAG: ATP-binding cassette domain-containing protein [Lachnospiraceae bacterium]|nr:ATP-binding cassette domain-containing protein [Lachnospiraceae bacterium]